MRPLRKAMMMFAARYVMRAIHQSGGNVSVAARTLGVSRQQVYVYLRRNGISRVSQSTYRKPSRPLRAFAMSPRSQSGTH